MTTLQRIRNHGVILLIVVGVAMLAFILGDFLNSGSSFFNRSRENVGVIAGHKVHYTEYEAAKNQLTEVHKIDYGINDINEDVAIQIRERVWQMLLLDYTLLAEAEKIGLTVTEDELGNLCVGENPHQILLDNRPLPFRDETGNFSRSILLNYLNFMEQEPANQEQAAAIQQIKTYWLYWENAIRITQLQTKYSSLISNLITANPLDAKYAFEARQTSVNVEYVEQPYFAVADSLVTVSDSDIKKLYKEQKEQYKRKPSRSLVYVSVPVVPSETDYAAAEELMKSLESDFQTSEDIASLVSGSSSVSYEVYEYSETTIPEEYKEFAFGNGAKKDQCTELALADDTYSIARLMDCGYNKPDSVNLVVLANDTTTQDQEWGWVPLDRLDKQIADSAVVGRIGSTFTISVGMQNYSIKIVDKGQPTPKVKLAILSHKVYPSRETETLLYNNAKQLIANNGNVELFRQAAQEQGLLVTPVSNLNENTPKVNLLPNSRQIVHWAYKAEKGQLSDVFICENQNSKQYIVAAVTEVFEGEYATLDEVREILREQVLKDKKAEYIMNQLKGVETLEAAAKLFDTEIMTAENITLASSYLGAAGQEPAAIGAALTLENNSTSAPIKGNMGVYIVRIGEKQTANEEFNAEQEIQQLNNIRTSYSVPYQEAIGLIIDEAEIEDNRARFE